jgi:hypothetical protein
MELWQQSVAVNRAPDSKFNLLRVLQVIIIQICFFFFHSKARLSTRRFSPTEEYSLGLQISST